jgi:type I restriction enzyme S subunit
METVVENKLAINRYPAYKDSGVVWLGEVPEHWRLLRMKRMFRDVSEKNKPNTELLSVTQNQGVVPRSWVEGRMVMPSGNLESFKFIRKGDFAISLRSFEGGLEFCHHDGIISPAYTVLRSSTSIDSNFYKFLFKSSSFISELQTSIVGIREGKNISYPELSYSFLPIPPLEEQIRIASFLDRKTAQIDKAIAQKVRLIELLKERRQATVQNVLVRGLNPNVQLKDSKIEWIGEIPAHWEVKKLKYALIERNDKSETGEETLFMVSQEHGLVVRADYHDKAVVAQSSVGNKRVFYNDLVFNKLKAHLGVFFKSTVEEVGLVSPDYAVYCSNGVFPDLKYLELLFRHPAYISQFICSATGIVEGLIRLYTGDLFNIKVPVPPIKEQAEILIYVEGTLSRISTAISSSQKEIEKLKEYKATLINSAVTGKIKVG